MKTIRQQPNEQVQPEMTHMQDSRPPAAAGQQSDIANSTQGDIGVATTGVLDAIKKDLTPEALEQFDLDWDAVGGSPCTSLRASAAAALQATPVVWRQLLFAADALQELCWEKLHTGHWMDVHVAWRDAYTLYTILAVTAKLALAAVSSVDSPPAAAAAGGRGGGRSALAEASVAGQSAAGQQQGRQHLGGLHAAFKAADPSTDPQLKSQQKQQQLLSGALKQLDLAAMMGGLRFRPLLNHCITITDHALQQCMQLTSTAAGDNSHRTDRQTSTTAAAEDNQAAGRVAGTDGSDAQAAAVDPAEPPKRQRTADCMAAAAATAAGAGSSAGSLEEQQQEVPLPPGSLTAASAVVPVELCPSIEQFLMKYMLADGGPKPVVIRGAMQHWPALTKWQDTGYLSRVAGRRTVPVELGQDYLQEGWGTSLMTFDDFLYKHITPAAGPGVSSPAPSTWQQQQQQAEPQQLGYLAQHQLFAQIPALAADVVTPDYCMLGEQGVSSINAWFGPPGTVTPLHQDPEHNLLAQVVGRKYVRLFDPCYTSKLYPHDEGMHTNTSQVDVEAVDDAVFPGFKGVPHLDLVLEPGDMLYMPPKWWHFVKSVSISFSVSFWWS